MEISAEQALERIEAAVELFMAGDYAGTLEQAGAADDILEAELAARGQETVLDAEAKHAPAWVRHLEAAGVFDGLGEEEIKDPEAAYRERANAARREGRSSRREAIRLLDRAYGDYRRLTGNYPLLGKSWREIDGDN